MELSHEASVAQGEVIIEVIKAIELLDEHYCELAAVAMSEQASRQNSMAALNPSFSPTKTKILQLKAESLMKIVELKKNLIATRDLELGLLKENQQFEEIQKFFM